MNLTNKVKQTLRDGGSAIGTFVPMPSPEVVELCALSGFDFVLFDAEHGRIDPVNVFPMILAAEVYGVPAFARVGQNDRQVILKYLDLGIAGVMIPQIITAEAANAAVAAMKYGPRGVRGLAGGRMFDHGTGEQVADLVPVLNERVLTIVQFEHIAALEHIETILATPDLDVLFVGPNDLAQSMGYPGYPDHPEVQAVIERVIAIARGGPVALGTVASNAAGTNRQLERGFRMIGSNAAQLLARGAQELLGGLVRPA